MTRPNSPIIRVVGFKSPVKRTGSPRSTIPKSTSRSSLKESLSSSPVDSDIVDVDHGNATHLADTGTSYAADDTDKSDPEVNVSQPPRADGSNEMPWVERSEPKNVSKPNTPIYVWFVRHKNKYLVRRGEKDC